jgi:geranylgeranyl reductase family protein
VPTEVDVAIVGGGPSGAAAAHFLAGRGHSVLVAEKKVFPREKTCGDGLTPRAVKQLEIMGLGDEISTWESVRGLRIHGAGRSMELPFPELQDWPSYGLIKPRKDLDSIVLSNAERAGAKVLFNTQAVEPIFERGVCNGFIAKRDGDTEEVRARFVICAEGAATKFGRALGRTRDQSYPMGLAIRQYFSSPIDGSGWFEAFLTVKARQDALPAYGWVFPVGDGTVNAGVGLLSTYGKWREVNLHDLQRDFIGSLPKEWEINEHTVCSKPRAGRLFMGGSVYPPHGPGFLMTGDAAGFINPCNGEGIAYGYETGRMAGRHIDEALRSGSSPILADYTRDLADTYGAYYRLGRRFVKLIGHPALMEKLVSMGMHSHKLMNLTLTLLANLEDSKSRTYDQMAMRFLKRLAEVKP